MNVTCFNTKQNFVKNVYIVIRDTLISKSPRRCTVYSDVLNDFQIFFDFDLTESKFNESLKSLEYNYASDIDATHFKEEIMHFVGYSKK